MRKLGLLLLTISMLVVPAHAADKEIRLATLNWAPYVGEELDQYGFTSEIVTKAFERAGYTVQIDFMPWARVLKVVERGRYDAAYPAYYSEERAQTYLMSEAFAQGPLGFYARADDDIAYAALEDLQPYKIGVVRGYVNTPEFDQADYLNTEAADSDVQNLKKLLVNRLDLVVIDKLTAQYIINTEMPDDADRLKFLDPPLDEKPLHVIFSREAAGYEEKVSDFNEGLRRLQEEGIIQEIMTYHGFE